SRWAHLGAGAGGPDPGRAGDTGPPPRAPGAGGRRTFRLGARRAGREGERPAAGARGPGGERVSELRTLIRLQEQDARIAGLEAEAARLPREMEAVQAALAEARRALETMKARLDATRKELRGREKDLD